MSISQHIDELSNKAIPAIPQKIRKARVSLYAEGLKAKLSQSQYALKRLAELSDQEDATRSTTDPDAYGIQEQVAFYCDTFWAFLYSTLDVLAQLVNQVQKLTLEEQAVSFKNVRTTLPTASSLREAFDKCFRSRAFKNLDRYRNCSTHRRQICIQVKTATTTYTPGYAATATGDVTIAVRRLCDNPLDHKPRFTQDRKLPDYMAKTMAQIHTHIELILDTIQPVS